MARSDLLVLTSASLRDQTLVSDSSLALVQEVAISWACWHYERRSEADKQGEKAFEEEDVAPLVDPHRGNAPFRNTGQPVCTVRPF